MLAGEDSAAYEGMVDRLFAATKPTDVIDEMYIDDIAALEWEVLRMRRIKNAVARSIVNDSLRDLLADELDLDHYKNEFVEILTEVIDRHRDDQAEDRGKSSLAYARGFVREDPDAMDWVNKLLDQAEEDADDIEKETKVRKVEALVRAYSRGESGAIEEVKELLHRCGRTIEDSIAEELPKKIDFLDRITI